MRPRGSPPSQLLIAFAASAVPITIAAAAGYDSLSRQYQAAKQLR